jgi:hypothetical protein
VRHVRMLGLCLVAALALAAMGASSALAGPQWVKCEKVAPNTGNYTGPNCTKAEKAKPKGSGEYELRKAPEIEAKRVGEGKSAGVPFTAEGGKGILSIKGRTCPGSAGSGEGVEINEGSERTRECEERGATEYEELAVECESEKASGEAVGTNKVEHIHVTFYECKALGFGCTNTGVEGEIQVNELKGKLGYINKNTSPRQVGVSLNPAAGGKARFATFTCANELLTTGVGVGKFTTEGCVYQENVKKCGGDSIISPITPINEMTAHFTQEYTQNAGDENVPQNLEGKGRDTLEAFVAVTEHPANSTLWSKAGEVVTNVNTPEEEGEIRA